MKLLEDAMTNQGFVKDVGKMRRDDPNYGKPQEGTKTAERGRKAHKHIQKEIVELCEMIYMYGVEDEEDGTAGMLFGDLFHLYTKISDKGTVPTLLCILLFVTDCVTRIPDERFFLRDLLFCVCRKSALKLPLVHCSIESKRC